MIYGTPTFRIDDDQTDRVGIRTLILSLLWQPSKWPMTLDELDAEEPDMPEVPGGVLFIGRQRKRERGGLRTFWTFEGIDGDGKSVTFKDRAHSIDYSFEPGFSERSILRLPGIEDLLNQYGGYIIDGQVIWPPTVPSTAASGPIVGASDGTPNPVFGQDTFFSVEGTYKFRYVAASLGDIPTGHVGKILTGAQLPGQVRDYGDGRNWLGLPPAPTRVGPVHHVEESYWLSGKGGWPKPIYTAGTGTVNTFGQILNQGSGPIQGAIGG